MAQTSPGGAASRRAFLAAGLVAPAAAAFVPAGAEARVQAAAGTPHALKIGTVTYNIAKDWDVPTIITNLTAIGLDAVEKVNEPQTIKQKTCIADQTTPMVRTG